MEHKSSVTESRARIRRLGLKKFRQIPVRAQKNVLRIVSPAAHSTTPSIYNTALSQFLSNLLHFQDNVDTSSRHLEITLQLIHVSVSSNFFLPWPTLIFYTFISREEQLQDVPENEIESNWDQVVDK